MTKYLRVDGYRPIDLSNLCKNYLPLKSGNCAKAIQDNSDCLECEYFEETKVEESRNKVINECLVILEKYNMKGYEKYNALLKEAIKELGGEG